MGYRIQTETVFTKAPLVGAVSTESDLVCHTRGATADESAPTKRISFLTGKLLLLHPGRQLNRPLGNGLGKDDDALFRLPLENAAHGPFFGLEAGNDLMPFG